MRVLMVEDDVTLANEVSRALVEYGIGVDCVETGPEAIVAATTAAFDVVLIDVMLPSTMDGFAVCRELRHRRIGAGIIMLTGRDAVRDRVTGLEAGADDYLIKPFAFQELLARIRALVRRNLPDRGSVLRLGNIAIDTRAHSVTVSGQSLSLTSKEHAILELFVHHSGQLLSAGQVHDHTWTYDYSPRSNLVQVYIARLRRKLEAAAADHTVTTTRGSGYRLEPIRSDG
ncbi:MAG: response regulator transcription factor [Candidatus Dormibacteria bacterium]